MLPPGRRTGMLPGDGERQLDVGVPKRVRRGAGRRRTGTPAPSRCSPGAPASSSYSGTPLVPASRGTWSAPGPGERPLGTSTGQGAPATSYVPPGGSEFGTGTPGVSWGRPMGGGLRLGRSPVWGHRSPGALPRARGRPSTLRRRRTGAGTSGTPGRVPVPRLHRGIVRYVRRVGRGSPPGSPCGARSANGVEGASLPGAQWVLGSRSPRGCRSAPRRRDSPLSRYRQAPRGTHSLA